MSEIVGPSSDLVVHFSDQHRSRHKARSDSDRLSQLGALSGTRLGTRNPVEKPLWSPEFVPLVAEGVTQKVEAGTRLLEPNDGCLLTVHLQAHPVFHGGFDPLADSPALITGQDFEIIGIAHELGSGKLRRSIPAVEPLVHPVQVEVGQQRTDNSTDNVANQRVRCGWGVAPACLAPGFTGRVDYGVSRAGIPR